MSHSRRYQSKSRDITALAEPLDFAFSGRTASNRFLKAAMTERMSSWDPVDLKARGVPTGSLIKVYQKWGEGGFGQILTGNIMIDYDQLEAPGNAVIPQEAPFSGDRFEAFKELATQAKKHGSLIVGQVSHPGRQVGSIVQQNPISASDVHLEGNVLGLTFNKPRAANEQEIKAVIHAFAHAAQYLEKSGFDGIQLHAAHGYLLAQFLSQTTNRRKDKYGGSIENRARLIIEVAQECRKRVSPSFIVCIKMNSVEFQNNGLSPEEAIKICQILEANRFDYVELSGGTYEDLAFQHRRDSTRLREAFFLDFAELIAPSLMQTKSYMTGGFKTVGAMVDALTTVDGIGLGRPACHEFLLPAQILSQRVFGAIKPRLDEDNFGLTVGVATKQMERVGKGQEPLDLSNEENVQKFMSEQIPAKA